MKALPLMTSLLLHVGILFALNALPHEGGRVFMVSLVTKHDISLSINQKAKLMSSNEESITPLSFPKQEDAAKPIVPDESDVLTEIPYHPSTTSIIKVEGLTSSTHDSPEGLGSKLILSPIVEGLTSSNPDSAGSGVVESAGVYKRISGGTGGIGDEDGNAIMEGEFGSINGPSFLEMVKPEYPVLARRLGKEGKVVLRLFINEHGKLINVEVIEKAGFGFDESAIEAVKTSTFLPARLNGLPVTCKAVLPVRFVLLEEGKGRK